MKKILVIDNYDSFVYNAVQLLRECPVATTVDVRYNDRIVLDELARYDGILLSPGPGVPSQAGLLLPAIREIVRRRLPVLGICLGHQALAENFGAELRQMSAPLHGHASTLVVIAPDDPLFRGVVPPVVVGRYHSWVVAPETLPAALAVTSLDEQGNVMSFRHRTLPLCGVQFHPESCISNCGRELIRNWLSSF